MIMMREGLHCLDTWWKMKTKITSCLHCVRSNVGWHIQMHATTNIDIVGWRTSSIRRNSELPKWEDYEKYPHIVYHEHCKACDADQLDPSSMEDDGSDKIEEELVKGLSPVSWEKIDVSFHNCRERFAAHSVIQVKDEVVHMEGADVIHHMIDHFLT